MTPISLGSILYASERNFSSVCMTISASPMFDFESSSSSSPIFSMKLSSAPVVSIRVNTLSNCSNFRNLTDSAAMSLESYIASELHIMISSCIRYCVFNMVVILAPNLLFVTKRSKSVVDNPLCAASSESTVGGSCKWSPANTNFLPLTTIPSTEHSKACAASSTTTTSNSSFFNANDNAPASVEQITEAVSKVLACANF
mmetsp:Transcript_8834/g.25712  ORF Transcript_8834/g.25712 Transcript_8834/m.25712 type:complete len:200 (+) Transcript_8834:439-1038(+)